MIEDEEWDLATMLEIDRLEASAVRASQYRSAAAPHLDEWDAGAAGMELSRPQESQNPNTSMKSYQQEIERLSAQLRLKDQEILDAKRQSLQKEDHLKEALAVMQRENDSLKKKQSDVAVGEKRKRSLMAYQVAACTANAVDSWHTSVSRAESSNVGTAKNGVRESLAEVAPQRENLAVVDQHSSKVLQNLHHVWCMDRRQAGGELLTKLFTTCHKDLQELLRADETDIGEDIADGRTSTPCSGNVLYDYLKQVLQGHRSLNTLFIPLSKYLSSQNTLIVQGALRIFHCLAGNAWRHFNRETDLQSLGNEGWNMGSNHCAKDTDLLPVFSPRITSKLKNPVSSDENKGGLARKEDKETALTFIKSILKLSKTHSDTGVKQEALSLVASFVVQTNPAQERLRVGKVLLEAGVLLLLKRSFAGSSAVQLHAVRIVHLFINCPQLLEIIWSRTGQLANTIKEALDGLCSCLTQDEDPVQDSLLRESALHTVAYLLSAKSELASFLAQDIGDGGDFRNIATDLVLFLDLELRHEEARKNAGDRSSLLLEAVSLLFDLVSHCASAATLLTKTPEVANRSLSVTNRLATLGSQFCISRPGRKPFPSASSMSIADMAKILRSKILSNSRDASAVS